MCVYACTCTSSSTQSIQGTSPILPFLACSFPLQVSSAFSLTPLTWAPPFTPPVSVSLSILLLRRRLTCQHIHVAHKTLPERWVLDRYVFQFASTLGRQWSEDFNVYMYMYISVHCTCTHTWHSIVLIQLELCCMHAITCICTCTYIQQLLYMYKCRCMIHCL